MGITQVTLKPIDDTSVQILQLKEKTPFPIFNCHQNEANSNGDSTPKAQTKLFSECLIEKELTANSTPEDTLLKKLNPPNQHSKSSCNFLNNDIEEGNSTPLTSINKNSELSQSAYSSIFREEIPFKKADINIDIKSVFRSHRHQTLTINSNSIKRKLNQKLIDENAMSINTNQIDYELNYYKTGEDMRQSYIAKLICKKVWVPSHKEKTHNSIIIFDWDDTLLCTTFISPNGVFNENMKLTEKEQEKVAKLEGCVFNLLSVALEKGDVYIITNAGLGWVEYSTERFYPSVMPLLTKIKIVSARGEYESQYPGDSRMWKIQAFLKTRKNFNSSLVTNIICLGDSVFEMEAGHTLATKFTEAVFKTVKFRECPKPEELQKQLTLVAKQFNSIYVSPKNLSIRVERKGK